MTTGGATWAGTTGVYTEGSGVATYAGGTSSAPGPNFAYLAYAGTNLLNGTTYTLSLKTTLTLPTGDRWNGIGFTSAAGGDAFTNGAGWMLNKGTGGDIQYSGNGFSGFATAAGAGSSATTLAIQLAINGAGAGSLSFYSGAALLNGSPVSLTVGQVDAIQGVGFFKYHDAAGTFDDFSFTTSSVPEPSTVAFYSLMGGVGLVYVVRRFWSQRTV